MPPQTSSISGDEIYLRLHSPKFFKELIDSRTASLVAAGDVEALAAWNQERSQKDRLWAELLDSAPNLKQKVLEIETFQDAVKGFVTQFANVGSFQIDPKVFEASIEDLLREEHEPQPPIDWQMEVNKEIDAFNAKEREVRNLEKNVFGRDAAAERKDFLADQERIGKEVAAMIRSQTQDNLHEKSEEITKAPVRTIDPPEQG
jgi:hypothetical protein